MPQDLDTYGDVELTSKESQAFARLAENKDFWVLADVLLRWQAKRGLDLLRSQNERQDFDLVKAQGGFELLRRILKLINDATK